MMNLFRKWNYLIELEFICDFIPGLWFKIAQSHLQEQAHDGLRGGCCFFAPFSK